MKFNTTHEPESVTWESPFKHPWWEPYMGHGDRPLSKDEWTIFKISKAIREKPDWKSKSKDGAIVEKWRKELRDQFKNDTKYIEELMDYVLEELKWYELVESDFCGVHEAGFVMAGDDRIVHSETAIPIDLKETLKKAVDKFVKLEFSNGNMDYHPGSNNQVVDLVHPSLYPVRYGKTAFYEATTSSKRPSYRRNSNDTVRTLKIAQFDDSSLLGHKTVPDYAKSKKFQWLPALMRLTSQYEDGAYRKGYTFSSYINNLPPNGNEELYDALSEVFNKSIAGLNLCLSRFKSPPIERISYPSYGQFYNEEYDKKLEEIEKKYEEIDYDDDYDEALEDLENEKAKYMREFKPVWSKPYPVDYTFDVTKSFPKLNVIVKLANIELTPETPNYKGGSWHVEGTINEDIIATILYYYDSENISESRLSFKAAFEDPEYEQNDYVGCREIYGLEDLDRMQREIGSVECKEGRVLIFPNWFQHHVDPFELKDKTKNGHRKIACYFICDPYNSKVINSSQVPPQQGHWWESKSNLEGFEKLEKKDVEKLLGDEAFMTLDTAKQIREELMKERSVPEDDDDSYMKPFVREFSLCEH